MPTQSQAAFSSRLSYQGKLTDAAGNIVTNGTYSIRFAIYTDQLTSNPAWSETQNVIVQNGVFSAMLGAINPINIDFNANEYFLGITVGSDNEMVPRRQIGASAMSINSKRLNGQEAGTGANNILSLNSSGEIDIAGKIKSSGGLEVTGGSINLPASSISSAALANGIVTADKLNVTSIDSTGKLAGLSSTYLANLDGSSLTGVVSSDIANGVVTNDKVNAAAAIAYSKLNLSGSVQGSDLANNININTTGNITTTAGNITLSNGHWFGLGSGAGNILFTDAATDVVSVRNANLDIDGSDNGITWNTNKARALFNVADDEFEIDSDSDMLIGPDGNYNLTLGDLLTGDIIIGERDNPEAGYDVSDRTIYLAKRTGDQAATSEAVRITMNEGTSGSAQDALVIENLGATSTGHALNVTSGSTRIGGELFGSASWVGQENAGGNAWGGATYAVSLPSIAANDVVMIFAITQPQAAYWVTVSANTGFTVHSSSGAETMGFNWAVLKR